MGAELKRWSSADLGGLLVARVAQGSAASVAGLLEGDRLLSLNHVPADLPAELLSAVRALREGDALAFDVLRGGERLQLLGKALPLPVESLEHGRIDLGAVDVHGYKLRTLMAMPNHSAPGYTSILYMQGLGNQSIELSSDPGEPLRAMLEAFCSAGLSVFRVDRRGVGDSEGPGCEYTDLFNEIDAYRAALRVLNEREDVGSVLLLGHSVGGMIAPLLLGGQLPSPKLKGAMVFGTSPYRWTDCMQWATYRQRQLAGLSGEALEHYVGSWMEMHRLVCQEGMSPEQVFQQYPHLLWLKGSSCQGETMFGRHISFFQQIQKLDLFALWRTVSVPVLVLHGSLDWAASPEHGRAIAEAINSSHARQAQFAELFGIGHDFRRHANLEASYKQPKEGRYDPAIADTMIAWIKAQGWLSG